MELPTTIRGDELTPVDKSTLETLKNRYSAMATVGMVLPDKEYRFVKVNENFYIAPDIIFMYIQRILRWA